MEITNPFQIPDILQAIAPFLNARVTYAAGNNYLRKIWMKTGKITADLAKISQEDLEKYSESITAVRANQYQLFSISDRGIKLVRVTKLITDHFGAGPASFKSLFPNLEILIITSKLAGVHNLIPIIVPSLSRIHADIDLTKGINTDVNRIYDLVDKFGDIHLHIGPSNLPSFISHIDAKNDDYKKGHYNIQCAFPSDHATQRILMTCSKHLRLKTGNITIVELIVKLSTILGCLQNTDFGQSKHISRKLTLILGKVVIKEDATNGKKLSDYYTALRSLIKEFREMNIDLSLNSSLAWFSGLFKKLKG